MPRRQIRFGSWGFLIAFVLVATAGCSSFNKDWKCAAQNPHPPSDIFGAWDGEWLSAVNGHNGRLRCILTQTGSDTIQARYKANYRGILRFGYTVTMREEKSNGARRFQGAANLGKLAGGVYEYVATISPNEFASTYTNRYDHGTFQMHRPIPSR